MQHADKSHKTPGRGLLDQIRSDRLELEPESEEAWIEVIQKMDEVYADLIASQVELEHKHTALEEAQRFIGSILSSMTDVLIVCGRNGNIRQTNMALEKLTGRTRSSLIGQPLNDLFTDAEAATVAGLMERLGTSQVIYDHEVSLIDVNGNPAPLSVNCSSLLDSKGRGIGMVLIGRSIGELRLAYKELDEAHQSLRQAQQQLIFTEKMAALGRLVAGVAHELNNPISFVFGNMHALRKYSDAIMTYIKAVDEGLGGEEAEELKARLKIDKVLDDMMPLVEGTLEGAKRVSDIVQDLRRFSGRQSEPKQVFDLPPVLQTAKNWVIKGAKRKPKIVTDMPKSLKLFGHKGHVHQIVVNLIQNAIDAMGDMPDPQIDISCGSKNNTAWVTIRDHGPGIPEADLPHIFEPFFTTKPIGDGTGLGLSVSYNMAEELEGRLTGENDADGGAVFTLELPLQEGPSGG